MMLVQEWYAWMVGQHKGSSLTSSVQFVRLVAKEGQIHRPMWGALPRKVLS